MQRNTIRLVVLFGALSVIGIILIQIYWVQKAFDLKKKQFEQTVHIALLEVAQKMARYNNNTFPNENPVNQVSSDYYVVHVNDIIDANILEHYLITEFKFRNINTDYEYAIYDCSSDKMVYGGYVNSSNDKEDVPSKNLPKLNQYTYYFGVNFPHVPSFLFNEMDVWMLSSFVLLIAIGFITYALFIILKQKRLAEIQKDFLDNMTHEFKTPIATIGIASEVLSRDDISESPDRLSRYAKVIGIENSRLKNQVDKLLQMAMIDNNKLILNKEDIDIHELIEKTITSFGLIMEEKNVDLRLDLQAKRVIVKADPFHVSNIIYNLLDNAIKYSDKSPEINIATSNWENYLRLSIQDKGIGIDKKIIKKVFNKFFRASTGNVHNVKGFGLGLNYVKNMVKAHAWEIRVESEPGKGSTFYILIPLN